MKQTFKYLDVPNHQLVSDQVYDFIVNQTDILKPRIPVFFNDVNTMHILDHAPALKDFLRERYLDPSLISIVVVTADETPYLHVDTIDPYVRLLWPVRNCENTVTKMYDVPREFLALDWKNNHSTNTYYDIVEQRDWPLVAEIELTRPVVLDVSVAHAVHPAKDATDHRISFTIGFDRDLPISRSIRAWFGFQR